MVIRGKSSSPCYLRIDNQGVRIKEAGWLWGKDSFETDRLIKEAEKEPSAGVSSIGPAGEKLCRFACINSELYRQAGRGGVGAVMGSKNLKAIVIKGKGHVEQHDRTRLVELNQSSFRAIPPESGCPGQNEIRNPPDPQHHPQRRNTADKELPVGTWTPALGKIDSEGVHAKTASRKVCISCITPCSLICRVSEGEYRGTLIEGPEYETLAMFGLERGD